MSAFPLPLPVPIDRIWGAEVLREEPWILEGDVIHNAVTYLQPRLRYHLAEGDHNVWVEPRTLMERGYANCEDASLAALSLLSAAGIRGGLAFYYDPAKGIGHTVAYFLVKTCCESFYRVLESREGTGIQEWEAEDLSAFKGTFGYPEWEKVT